MNINVDEFLDDLDDDDFGFSFNDDEEE